MSAEISGAPADRAEKARHTVWHRNNKAGGESKTDFRKALDAHGGKSATAHGQYGAAKRATEHGKSGRRARDAGARKPVGSESRSSNLRYTQVKHFSGPGAGSPRRRGPRPGPDAPGLKRLQGSSGPNHYRIDVDGPHPNLAVGGSHDQQESQRDANLALFGQAVESYVTGHSGLPRVPSDAKVSHTLNQLPRNPPIGRDGGKVIHTVYRSHIPNATPKHAYRHFVNHPGQVFSAGGMEIRPRSGHLQDGGRYMIETGNPGPIWLPVQMKLHPKRNAVTIHTLKGHLLRGRQTFTFSGDGHGGTNLTQNAHFQASSQLPGKAQRLASISRGQHQAWRGAHREMYEQFNGNPGYQGIGTHALSSHQLRAWAHDFDHAAEHPGNTADSLLDTGGVASNWGIDHAGESMSHTLDRLRMPAAGDAVRKGSDELGDWTQGALDKAGDGAKWLIQHAG